MLVRKSVSVVNTRMHLWDEAGNHVHDYDRRLEPEMCAFLDGMLDQGLYTRRSVADGMSLKAA